MTRTCLFGKGEADVSQALCLDRLIRCVFVQKLILNPPEQREKTHLSVYLSNVISS